jgi:hypothetical protein
VQFSPQQSQFVAHMEPSPLHGVLHFFVIGSQMPWQQSESIVQLTPSGLQAFDPQRSGF